MRPLPFVVVAVLACANAQHSRGTDYAAPKSAAHADDVSISSSAMLGSNHLNNTRFMSQLCTSQPVPTAQLESCPSVAEWLPDRISTSRSMLSRAPPPPAPRSDRLPGRRLRQKVCDCIGIQEPHRKRAVASTLRTHTTHERSQERDGGGVRARETRCRLERTDARGLSHGVRAVLAGLHCLTQMRVEKTRTRTGDGTPRTQAAQLALTNTVSRVIGGSETNAEHACVRI